MDRSAKALITILGVFSTQACVPRTPTIEIEQLTDGRIAISVSPSEYCVQSIGIGRVGAGPDEPVVWALARTYPDRPETCRSQFVFREVPEGYYEWPSSAELSGELTAGQEYEVEIHGAAFHGETTFMRIGPH